MDFDALPLPHPDSDFVVGDTPRNHRSHFAVGFTLDQVRYNCRLQRARDAAAAQPPEKTPLRDAQARILDLLK